MPTKKPESDWFAQFEEATPDNTPSLGYSGAPDEPLQRPPFYADPVELVSLLFGKGAGTLTGGLVAGGMERVGSGIVSRSGRGGVALAKLGAKRALGHPITVNDLNALLQAVVRSRGVQSIAEPLGNSITRILH